MNVLFDSIQTAKDHNKLLWSYSEKPDVYTKFTQYVTDPPYTKCTEEPKIIAKGPSDPSIVTKTTITEIPTIMVSKDIVDKSVPITVPKPYKSKRSAPMDVIINLAENDHVNADHIKKSLEDFITKKEFQKVFGIKKTTEVMKGLAENKWNKSFVLFLSFLFDVSFVYLNKDVMYDTSMPDKYSTKITL